MTLATHQVQVRWPDVDGLGHVNHSTILVYLEVGRDAILAAHGIAASDYVVRHCEVDYHGELRPDGAYAEYGFDGLQLGRTSIRVQEHLEQIGGGVSVSSEFVLVLWDKENRSPRELTDAERLSLRDLEIPELERSSR